MFEKDCHFCQDAEHSRHSVACLHDQINTLLSSAGTLNTQYYAAAGKKADTLNNMQHTSHFTARQVCAAPRLA